MAKGGLEPATAGQKALNPQPAVGTRLLAAARFFPSNYPRRQADLKAVKLPRRTPLES